MTTLLTYQFPTNPQPLQGDTSGTDTSGLVDVVVSSDGSAPVYCNKIQIGVPVGTDPGSLTPNNPVVTPSTAQWVVSSAALVAGAEFGLSDAITVVAYTCTATTPEAYEIDYPLAFSIRLAPVSSELGAGEVHINEYAATSSDPSQFSLRQAAFPVMITAPEFFLRNFVSTGASAVDDVFEPIGEFANGAPVRLAWDSNATSYTLISTSTQTPVYQGTDRSFTLTAGLTDTTTFILIAAATGGADSPQSGFETINLYASITVQITNPDLTPTSVTASGSISAGGQLSSSGITVTGSPIVFSLAPSGGGALQIKSNPNDNSLYLEGSSSTGAASASKIALTGMDNTTLPRLELNAATIETFGAAINSGTVTSTGDVTSSGNLNCKRVYSTNGAYLSLEDSGGGQLRLGNNPNDNEVYLEAFSSDGQASANRLTLGGRYATPLPMWFNASSVEMFGSYQNLSTGSYTASTDGYVAGYVGYTSDPGTTCVAWLTVTCDGFTVKATGGNNIYDQTWSGLGDCTNPNSLLLPVPKGKQFSVSSAQGPSNDEDAPISLRWIPLGTGAGAEDAANAALVKISDDVLPEHAAQHQRPEGPAASRRSRRDAVEKLAALLGGLMASDEEREAVRDALLDALGPGKPPTFVGDSS